MKILSVATMQKLDASTIAAGTPGEVLMQRAGDGACQTLLEFLRQTLPPRHWRRFVVLAGKGNNGGDAYVVARQLHLRTGLPVYVYSVCPKERLTGAARLHAENLPHEIPFYLVDGDLPADALTPGTVVIDGMLGTGVAGALRPPYPALIDAVNRSGCFVAALDLPSGLDADSGEIATCAIEADLTMTMALPKRGMLENNGLQCCGALRRIPLGIPTEMIVKATSCGEAIFADDVAPLLDRRGATSHKGTFGHALVIAGSTQYCGAPMLTGAGALRAGAGLVTVAVPAAARPLLQPPLAALILQSIPDAERGSFGPAGREVLQELLRNKINAIIFGPGTSRQRDLQAVLTILRHDPKLPLVIDADGLYILAQQPEPFTTQTAVLTPHPGEWRALADGFGLQLPEDANRRQQAVALARQTGAFVVLKGAGTVIAAPDGRSAVNTSGNNGLASGGTGDVLAGVIGGLLAQNMGPWDACCLGTFIHGYAAELACCGRRALVADDLPTLLGKAMLNLSPFA